jgi:hypothetical protein
MTFPSGYGLLTTQGVIMNDKNKVNPLKCKPKRLRRKATTVLAIAASGALCLGPVRRAAACWFDPIVFDPTALVAHVEQVVQLGQQISAVV